MGEKEQEHFFLPQSAYKETWGKIGQTDSKKNAKIMPSNNYTKKLCIIIHGFKQNSVV